MSSAKLPALIDPLKLVDMNVSLQGVLRIAQMKRLLSAVVDHHSVVEVALHFFRDAQRLSVIEGTVKSTLKLCCQRCMASLSYPIEAQLSLALVSNEEAAKSLPTCYDPLLVKERDYVSLAELVEDELLLALPLIPRHAEGGCEISPLANE